MKTPNQGYGNDQVTESILVAKVARLTEDGGAVGPGSYNLEMAHKASMPSPKGIDNWLKNKTKRRNHFTQSTTGKELGPGTYAIERAIDRSIHNPTIPR